MEQPGSDAFRIGWPRIVTYRYGGRGHVCPPRDNTPYRITIKDRDAYEELARSGKLYAAEHTGARYQIIDERATS